MKGPDHRREHAMIVRRGFRCLLGVLQVSITAGLLAGCDPAYQWLPSSVKETLDGIQLKIDGLRVLHPSLSPTVYVTLAVNTDSRAVSVEGAELRCATAVIQADVHRLEVVKPFSQRQLRIYWKLPDTPSVLLAQSSVVVIHLIVEKEAQTVEVDYSSL